MMGAYDKPKIVNCLIGRVDFRLDPFAMVLDGFLSAP
jgi:hypothetical protein